MKTLALFSATTAFTCLSSLTAEERTKPNIIIFLVDDMGVMDTSVPFLTDVDGKPKKHRLNNLYKTPSMARLAKQGVRFNQFCAQSVCSPTRASILTGQNATRHRTTNWINPYSNNRTPHGPLKWNWVGLGNQDTTLPRLLEPAGYHSIHVGKGHFGPFKKSGADPLNLGFDVNIAGHAAGQPGSYYGKKNYGKGPYQVPDLEKYHGSKTFLTEALTIEAKAAIRASIEKKKPFLLYMSHYALHAPFHSDPRFIANYKSASISKRAKAYASLVEGMDKSLGDLMDHLEAQGVAENTLIIFLGDNGSDAPLGGVNEIASSAPLRGKKGTRYEGGMRVPFIAAWAKPNSKNYWQKKLPITQGAIQGQLASVNDLLPTITQLAGVTLPNSHKVDGRNLAPLLSGKRDPDWKESFLMHFPHHHNSSYFTSYRNADWKVIYHYPVAGKKVKYELYNLKKDPSESSNLAKSQPKQLRTMMLHLIKGLTKEGALYPINKQGKELKPKLPSN